MITTDELVKRVRRLINEAEEDEYLSLLTEDTRSINEHILRLLPQAVTLVQKNKTSAAGCVNPRKADTEKTIVSDCGNGMGMLVVPDDFAQFVSLQLKGWKRPCKELYTIDSAEAAAQYNMYTRAGLNKPVCFLGASENGPHAIFLSPLPVGSGGVLGHFVYEAVFDAEAGLAECSEIMADAVAYYCAALLYNVFERQAQANTFLSLATVLCNGKSVERG